MACSADELGCRGGARRQLLDKGGAEGGPAEPHRILRPSIDEVVKFGGNPIRGFDEGDVGQVERIEVSQGAEAVRMQGFARRTRKILARIARRFEMTWKVVRSPGRIFRLPLTSSTEVTPSDVSVLAGIAMRLRWSIRVLAVALVVFLVALALR